MSFAISPQGGGARSERLFGGRSPVRATFRQGFGGDWDVFSPNFCCVQECAGSRGRGLAGTQFGVFLVLPLFRGISAQSNKGVFTGFSSGSSSRASRFSSACGFAVFPGGKINVETRRDKRREEGEVRRVEGEERRAAPGTHLSDVERRVGAGHRFGRFLSAGVFSGTFGLLVNTESVIEAELNMMLGTLLDSMDQLCALKMQGGYC